MVIVVLIVVLGVGVVAAVVVEMIVLVNRNYKRKTVDNLLSLRKH